MVTAALCRCCDDAAEDYVADLSLLSTIVADWDDARCSDGRPLRRFAAADYRCAVAAPTAGSGGHPGIAWTIAVTLGSILVLATALSLVGLTVRLIGRL